MRAHMLRDALSGAAVAAAPWLSGSARRGTKHWLPHAVLGGTKVALALRRRTRPRDKPAQRARRVVRDATPRLTGRKALAVGVALAGVGALAYAGSRLFWQATAVAAKAVEEVADAVEDAADDLKDAAKERAEGTESGD